MMAGKVQKATSEAIQVLPWDFFEPSFTHYTVHAGTFVLFLKQPDSQYYEIAYGTPFQMGVRLYGPNANEVVFQAQREYDKGIKMTQREDAMSVVSAMRNLPKKMDQRHRERLAAQVALFLGLDQRVR